MRGALSRSLRLLPSSLWLLPSGLRLTGLLWYVLLANGLGAGEVRRGDPAFVPDRSHPVGWRGDGSGCYPGAVPPTRWDITTGLGIRWLRRIPAVPSTGGSVGLGNGDPIVVGDRLILAAEPHRLLCLDALTGDLRWQTDHPPLDPAAVVIDPAICDRFGWTTPTPVSDGHQLWNVFGHGLVVCVGLDGKARWSAPFTPRRGDGSGVVMSPVLCGEVLVTGDAADAALIGWQADTGKRLWSLPPSTGDRLAGPCIGAPLRCTWQGKTALAIHGGAVIDPATGKILDQIPGWIPCGPAPVAMPGGLVITDPVSGAAVRWSGGSKRTPLLPADPGSPCSPLAGPGWLCLASDGRWRISRDDGRLFHELAAVGATWSAPVLAGDVLLGLGGGDAGRAIGWRLPTSSATAPALALDFPHRLVCRSDLDELVAVQPHAAVCSGQKLWLRDEIGVICVDGALLPGSMDPRIEAVLAEVPVKERIEPHYYLKEPQVPTAGVVRGTAALLALARGPAPPDPQALVVALAAIEANDLAVVEACAKWLRSPPRLTALAARNAAQHLIANLGPARAEELRSRWAKAPGADRANLACAAGQLTDRKELEALAKTLIDDVDPAVVAVGIDLVVRFFDFTNQTKLLKPIPDKAAIRRVQVETAFLGSLLAPSRPPSAGLDFANDDGFNRPLLQEAAEQLLRFIKEDRISGSMIAQALRGSPRPYNQQAADLAIRQGKLDPLLAALPEASPVGQLVICQALIPFGKSAAKAVPMLEDLRRRAPGFVVSAATGALEAVRPPPAPEPAKPKPSK